MGFQESLNVGKIAEQFAENYFHNKRLTFKNVTNDPKFQKIDVDYVVRGLNYVEVKLNLVDAIKGKKGRFFWIEIGIDNKNGWWGFTQAHHFLFFNNEGDGVLIKNDDSFKKYINDAIENGDHCENGNHRFDYKKDNRYNGYVTSKNMRVYLEDVDYISIKKEAAR